MKAGTFSKIINIIGLAALIICVLYSIWPQIIFNHDSLNNLYIQQAVAFLHGRLDIASNAPDASVYNGKYYVYNPFTSIIVLPFIIFGKEGLNIVFISLVTILTDIFLLYKILKKVGIPVNCIIWSVIALFFGTGYWFCMAYSTYWGLFSHLAALFFLLLVINESFGKSRGFLTGLFYGIAGFIRPTAFFSLIFIAAVMFFNEKNITKTKKLFNLAAFSAGFAVCAGAILWMNYLRFGNVLDFGYSHCLIEWKNRWDGMRISNHGLFSPVYFVFNFLYMFFQGFHINFKNIGDPLNFSSEFDGYATSILTASPFILMAFYAKWKKPLLISASISIILTLIFSLFFYSAGFWQLNTYRYVLEIFPILIILVALGMKELNNNTLCKFSVIYAVLQNVLVVLLMNLVNLANIR